MKTKLTLSNDSLKIFLTLLVLLVILSSIQSSKSISQSEPSATEFTAEPEENLDEHSIQTRAISESDNEFIFVSTLGKQS